MQTKITFYLTIACAFIAFASFTNFATSDFYKDQSSNFSPLTTNRKFNSQEANPAFENFLTNFLAQTFSGKKFDRLVSVSSPLILKFTDAKNLGFGRFWNMGIYCSLYDTGTFGYDLSAGEEMPRIGNLKYFPDRNPEGGFCEESTSPDGIYYKLATELPEDYDIENDRTIPTPTKLNNLHKMRVNIQFDLWVIKTLYFVEFNGKWNLLYIDDCDCSA